MKQKIYLLLENLEQLKNLNICFVLDLFFLDWYLFLIIVIVLLKPNSNCLSSFTLSLVNKISIATKVLYQLF